MSRCLQTADAGSFFFKVMIDGRWEEVRGQRSWQVRVGLMLSGAVAVGDGVIVPICREAGI